MRRIGIVAASWLFAFSLGGSPEQATAAPYGYADAAQNFEQNLSVDQRILAQILLVSAGYGNAVPVEHFNTRIMKAIQQFQADAGFNPNGVLDKPQIDRLSVAGGQKLDLWGFRRVSYLGRDLSIWVPLALGLDVKQNGSGLHFKDRQGRLALDMVSLPDKDVVGVYDGLLGDKLRENADIHFKVIKDGWFVISTTATDGTDHYYRYHQDGGAVTGFALEWNNAVENINAERIATIMSGSLWAAMTGAPYIDPPQSAPQAAAPPPIQPAAVPVAPVPTPPKTTFNTGTGFFVSETGHFITNAHVVANCSDIVVKADDGSMNAAERVATDTTNDLALLKLAKVPKTVVALRIGARLGEGVEAFGFPHTDLLASAGNFTLGNISALSGIGDDSRYLQISAPVQAGNSGGPLLDTSGNLVGVVSSKLNAMKVMQASDDLPQNVNFAIKSGTLANFLDANRVTYKVGAPAAVPMQPADIADAARAVSGFVVCR